MPRKSKHASFKGVAKQFLPHPLPANSTCAISSLAKVENKSLLQPSSFKRKFSSNAIPEIDYSLSSASDRLSGFCLIDMKCLESPISKLHMCKDGKLCSLIITTAIGTKCFFLNFKKHI